MVLEQDTPTRLFKDDAEKSYDMEENYRSKVKSSENIYTSYGFPSTMQQQQQSTKQNSTKQNQSSNSLLSRLLPW
jgi:hypothetical protein